MMRYADASTRRRSTEHLPNANLIQAERPKCPECNSITLKADEKICIFCANKPGPAQKKARVDEQKADTTEETADDMASQEDTMATAPAREDTPHPDDAPPDEAIGQQRCDEPPVAAVTHVPFTPSAPPTPQNVTEDVPSAPPTPRSVGESIAPSVFTLTAPTEDELIKRALLSMDPRLPVDHSAFAKLIALRLERRYALERVDKENLVIQWFDPRKRVWVRGGGARVLHEVATETLHRMFCNLPPEKRTIFGNKGFISPIVDLLKNHIARDGTADMPPLDGEQTRNRLRFSCGNVLDFTTGEVRPCEPEDRISLCTGYPYSDWDAPEETKAFVAQMIRDLLEVWNRNGSWEELEGAEERMGRLLTVSPMYRIIFQLFEDHGMADWIIMLFVLGVMGTADLEELLFLADARGTNGKGTLLALLKAVLGALSDGYYATLEYAKHFVGNGVSRMNINNPDIAALAGKRVVAVNETPDGGDAAAGGCFNAALAKSLASGDEPLVASAKYKDPSTFYPQCLLIFCTNAPPVFPAKDGGLKSRISFVNMPFEWVPNPTEPGQRKIDVNIKNTVIKTLPPEFLFWARHLAPGLKPKGRLVSPRPHKVTSDTETQFLADAIRANPEGTTPQEVGQRFARDYIVDYQESWFQGEGVRISTRDEINKAFLEWAAQEKHRCRPHEAFRGILDGTAQDTRKIENGKKVRVYWRPGPSNALGVGSRIYVTLKSAAPRDVF
jgi:hypothetical protein